MGIKNVNKVIKEQSPRAFTSVNVSDLSGQRIAIDGPLWFYTNWASATKDTVRRMKDVMEEVDLGEVMKKCINSAAKFHLFFMENKITPIWLKDGKSPNEKTETKEKRRLARKKRQDKIVELKERIAECDILMRDPKDLKELRILMQTTITLVGTEFETFYHFIKGFGFPLIQSPGESEAYASAMNKKGLIYGVWTTDTDCYALGGVNMITGFSGKNEYGEDMLSVVHIPHILKDINFTDAEMLDFCIMCGTDFNDNIPNVGSTRAFKHIQKHSSIEEFEKSSKKDCSVLKYVKSRQLLSPEKCNLNEDSPELLHNFEKFENSSHCLAAAYDIENEHSRIESHYGKFKNLECKNYNPNYGPNMIKPVVRIKINGKKLPTHIKRGKPLKPTTEIEYSEETKNVTTLEELLALQDKKEKDKKQTVILPKKKPAIKLKLPKKKLLILPKKSSKCMDP